MLRVGVPIATLALITALPAYGATLGPFTFKNTSGVKINDAHIIFTGTGGTLTNPLMTNDPVPVSKITAMSNMVWITFGEFITPGTEFAFTVDSVYQPIQPNSIVFTRNGVPVPVPESTSTLGLLSLGTLGAASNLKRKLKSSQPSEKETTKVS